MADYNEDKAYSGLAAAGCSPLTIGSEQLNQKFKATQASAESSYMNGRILIDRLIDHHNRQSVALHALLRGIPREMSCEAEQGLYELAKAALGKL